MAERPAILEVGLEGRGHDDALVVRSLAAAPHGVWQQIESLTGPAEARDRLLDLGFTPGAEVKIVQAAPFGDPLIVLLLGTRLALRKQEAAWITVK